VEPIRLISWPGNVAAEIYGALGKVQLVKIGDAAGISVGPWSAKSETRTEGVRRSERIS